MLPNSSNCLGHSVLEARTRATLSLTDGTVPFFANFVGKFVNDALLGVREKNLSIIANAALTLLTALPSSRDLSPVP